MPAPTLIEGVVQLDEFGPGDVDVHLVNEDEEMARRFGWWPNRSTTHHVRVAFDHWAGCWASASYAVGPHARRRGFASRALRRDAVFYARSVTARP